VDNSPISPRNRAAQDVVSLADTCKTNGHPQPGTAMIGSSDGCARPDHCNKVCLRNCDGGETRHRRSPARKARGIGGRRRSQCGNWSTGDPARGGKCHLWAIHYQHLSVTGLRQLALAQLTPSRKPSSAASRNPLAIGRVSPRGACTSWLPSADAEIPESVGGVRTSDCNAITYRPRGDRAAV
jgi:hypothetical protein